MAKKKKNKLKIGHVLALCLIGHVLALCLLGVTFFYVAFMPSTSIHYRTVEETKEDYREQAMDIACWWSYGEGWHHGTYQGGLNTLGEKLHVCYLDFNKSDLCSFDPRPLECEWYRYQLDMEIPDEECPRTLKGEVGFWKTNMCDKSWRSPK